MPRFEFKGKFFNNPVELALFVFGGRWKMPILWRLKERAWRYSELNKSLGKVTHKMLSQQLKELERDGLINKKIFASVPPRVEYSLTKRGKSVIPLINKLRDWGIKFKEEEENK
ncbi:MAG TPA: transcriptional regulator [Bacteroidetes bacterium]|nr:helix-turn-helix transcriptional regulator [Ignavibacteria bacterium]HCA41670.1 transcriptional regulator [Bacteroidota bacterium]HCN38512.1 transcriptional regulator [Bacteroidota bacterium]